MEIDGLKRIITNYNSQYVDNKGANEFDELVIKVKSDINLKNEISRDVLQIIKDESEIFTSSEKFIVGLMLFLSHSQIIDIKIASQLKEKSEKNISSFPKISGIILRFLGSIDSKFIDDNVVKNSNIKSIDFWLWIDILFRINNINEMTRELLVHFNNNNSNDYNLFFQRIIYWKNQNKSIQIDNLINDIYSVLPYDTKCIMTGFIDSTLKNQITINRFDGIEFIKNNYQLNYE